MERNLFIFAIGGTGSRVLKSLIFLLAAGVKIPNTKKIIPIIIDPDINNGDLTRTIELLKLYNRLRNKVYTEKCDFLYHDIRSLKDIDDENQAINQFIFDFGKIRNKKFKDFIELDCLSKENKAFSNLLFSEKNLELDMEVGFKGNPNIGSIVLNQLKNEDFFIDFSKKFGKNDRIFIISSIFGGTGASGFPIILKNLRFPSNNLSNTEYLKNAKIGAISIMPYFYLDNPEGEVNSETFISKTIAAIKYYSGNIFDTKLLDAFYSIGDMEYKNTQKGADGKAEQKNKAHFVEIAAALSIAHFMELNDNQLEGDCHEFGTDHPQNNILYFHQLSKKTQNSIKIPLTKWALFFQYIKNIYPQIKTDKKVSHIHSKSSNDLTENSLQSILTDLNKFMDEFMIWLTENKESEVSFQPFNLDLLQNLNKNELFNFINGVTVPKKTFSFFSTYYNDMISELNEYHDDFRELSSEKKLFALLSKVTGNIVKNTLKLN